MKILCVQTYPTEAQIRSFGVAYNPRQAYAISVGREYTVMAISVEIESPGSGTCVLAHIHGDYGRPTFPPLVLFRVIDPRPSRLWTIGQSSEGRLFLGPQLLHDAPYLYDDLSNGDATAVAQYASLRTQLEAE